MSRLSETLQPERGVGRDSVVLVVCLLSDDWSCLGMIAMMRYMYICMDICLMDCYICVT